MSAVEAKGEFAHNRAMTNPLLEGLSLIKNKDYQAAHGHAIALIHRNTADPAPYYLLARIALDHQNYAKAQELFTKARDLAPSDPLYIAGLGQFLVTIGRSEQALACADDAVALPLGSAMVADTLGVIYSRAGFHEKAVPLFEKAVALDPKPANFHYNLGASLQFSGRFQEAENAYRAAIARQPDNHRAYSSLVGLSVQTEQNHLLDTLVPLFDQSNDQANDQPDARLHLGHAIAKTLEDLGRLEESFHWLGKAKEQKRRSLNYQIEADLALFDAAAKTASETPSAPATDAGPIFIVGLPRTGTTLVDRIISSHPEVCSVGELNTFADSIKTLANTDSATVLDAATMAAAADANPEQLSQVGHEYLRRTRDLARGAARHTDKMPLNFFYAGLICRALPKARIIVLRRDPMDSCLSNYRQLFSTGFSYYNYSLDILDTGRYYQSFHRLISHWQTVLPAENLLQVAYEDIVFDQENQTRKLLEFCGLSWFQGCLNFHHNPSPVSTASSVQVRQPLYSRSIGRWKHYGDALQPLRQLLIAQGLMDSSGT